MQCTSIMSAVYCNSSLQCKVVANRTDVQTTGLEERHRDPSQYQGWNWNLNSQIICGFRAVASTVPMTVLNDTSSAGI